MFTCQGLALVLLLMQFTPADAACFRREKAEEDLFSSVVEFICVPNQSFAIPCDVRSTGYNASDIQFGLKLKNGSCVPSNCTIDLNKTNKTHVTVKHPGLPHNTEGLVCWRLKGSKTSITDNIFISFKDPPEEPVLLKNETVYSNYKVITLKWKIYLKEKPVLEVKTSYAKLQFRGIKLPITCYSNDPMTDPIVTCNTKLQAPPGTNLTVTLVSYQWDYNMNVTSTAYLNLDDYVVPDPVKNPVVSVNSNQAVVNWTAPYTVAALNYTLQYSSKYQLNPENVTITNDTSVVFPNLCAKTEYTYNITAYSANSVASPTHEGNFTTPCSEPGKVQVSRNNYHVLHTDKDNYSVIVYWKMYVCQYGCDGLQFQLNLHSPDEHLACLDSFKVSGDLRSMVIPLKNHRVPYEITLRAENTKGTGPVSDKIIIPPLKADVKPPPNFTVIWTNKSVLLFWKDWKKPTIVYACHTTPMNSSGDSKDYCHMMLWKKPNESDRAIFPLCSENRSTLDFCNDGEDFCTEEQECIKRNSLTTTKIGIGFDESSMINSGILWANCIYDNTQNPEVPDLHVKPGPTSLEINLEPHGLSPCKRPYMHKYKAIVKSLNTTKEKVEIELNRHTKREIIPDLQSSHRYKVSVIGIKEDKLIILNELETATTEGARVLAFKPFFLIPLFVVIMVTFAAVWYWLRQKRHALEKSNTTEPRDNLSINSSDDEYSFELECPGRGDYHEINIDNDENNLWAPDTTDLEIGLLSPMENGVLKQNSGTQDEADSALGGTLSRNDWKEIKESQKLQMDANDEDAALLNSESIKYEGQPPDQAFVPSDSIKDIITDSAESHNPESSKVEDKLGSTDISVPSESPIINTMSEQSRQSCSQDDASNRCSSDRPNFSSAESPGFDVEHTQSSDMDSWLPGDETDDSAAENYDRGQL